MTWEQISAWWDKISAWEEISALGEKKANQGINKCALDTYFFPRLREEISAALIY